MFRSGLMLLAVAGALGAPRALANEPSAYSLATHAALRGSLVTDPAHPVVKASVYFSEDETDFPPLDGLSREALRAEGRRLTEELPSLATGITTTVLGGCGLLTGFILLYAGFLELITSSGSSASAATAYVLFGLGAALMVGGGIMLAIGLVRLVGSIRERRAYNERLEEINKRLEGGDLAPPVYPPGSDAPPPPPPGAPPPPPPSAMGNVPDASVLVATF